MTGSYFVGRLRERYGLQVVVAEGEHQENVHSALYAELAKGIFCPLRGISSRLRSRTLSSAARRPSSSDAPSSACSSKPGTARCLSSTRPSHTPRLPSTWHCKIEPRRGARILGSPTTTRTGERRYSVEDLAGHQWTFTQVIADLAPRIGAERRRPSERSTGAVARRRHRRAAVARYPSRSSILKRPVMAAHITQCPVHRSGAERVPESALGAA